jgi:hypothetical protein
MGSLCLEQESRGLAVFAFILQDPWYPRRPLPASATSSLSRDLVAQILEHPRGQEPRDSLGREISGLCEGQT